MHLDWRRICRGFSSRWDLPDCIAARMTSTLRFTCPLVHLTCRIRRDYNIRALKWGTINFTRAIFAGARVRSGIGAERRRDAPRTRETTLILLVITVHRARGEPLDRAKNAFSIIAGTRSTRGESLWDLRDGEDVHDRDTRVTASAYTLCVMA